MSTHTLPFTVVFTNGLYRFRTPSFFAFDYVFAPDQLGLLAHPSRLTLFYVGPFEILFDYVFCTNIAAATRDAFFAALIALNSASTIVSGTVAVSNFPATQAVTQSTSPWVTSGTVTNFPATQPVSGTVTANQGTSPWVTSGTVTNFPATQPVSGTVAVSNFPASQPVTGTFFQATQPVSGTVAVTQSTSPWVTTNTPSVPASTDLVGASRTTTGTLVTIPAGRTFFGSLSLSSSSVVVGVNNPAISSAGAAVVPTGTLHQTLSSIVSNNANTLSDVYVFGGTAGATLTFTVGATGVSSGEIAGRLL